MKVKFNGASDTDTQANFGGGKDPREYLEVDEIYDVVKEEVHSWRTLYHIWASISDKDKMRLTPFNSVCFTKV